MESKLIVESLLRNHTRDTGMPMSAIRFGQVHAAGSAQRPTDPDFDDRIVMTDDGLFGGDRVGDARGWP